MRIFRLMIIAVTTVLAISGPAGADERPLVVVSIAPEGWLVERLAGDAVRLEIALAPGESPASYDPTPRRLARLSGARLYLAVGVPMESILLPRLGSLCEDVKVVDLSRGQTRLAGHDHGHHHDHEHAVDPHVWVSPRRMADLADAAARALGDLVPEAKAVIDANLVSLRTELATLDTEVATLLAPAAGRTMVVFHPSFGYLAHDYGFVQTAIEKDGLPPSPRHLATVLSNIREQNVQSIFVQPQSASAQLNALAKSENLGVVVLDPLARDYPENTRRMAAAIGDAFSPVSDEKSAP